MLAGVHFPGRRHFDFGPNPKPGGKTAWGVTWSSVVVFEFEREEVDPARRIAGNDGRDHPARPRMREAGRQQ